MQSRRDTTTPQARRHFGIRFAVRIFPIIKVPVDSKLTAVGFEPTPPKRLRPERSVLDHSTKGALG